MRLLLTFASVELLRACAPPAEVPEPATDTAPLVDSALPVDTGPVDADGDGYARTDDCDDTTSSVYPGAAELCNTQDDNCDGVVDDGAWLPDDDGDGYAADAVAGSACKEAGRVTLTGDCDDATPAVSPAAEADVCGEDTDCDGVRRCSREDEARWTWVAEGSLDDTWFGLNLSVADLDGDGAEEILAGASGWDTTHENRGAVFILAVDPTQPPGTFHVQPGGGARWALLGSEDEYAGAHSAFVGDLDHDGSPELIVSASGVDGAYVVPGARLLGAPDEVYLAEVASQFFDDDLQESSEFTEGGFPVGDGGDLDGDGTVDLLVGGYGGEYFVFPFDTTLARTNASTDAVRIHGEYGYRYAPASPGDMNGDGIGDLALSFASDAGGMISVFWGGAFDWGDVIEGEEADFILERDVSFGAFNSAALAVCAAGDLDGDGLLDLFTGWVGSYLDEKSEWEGALYPLLAASTQETSYLRTDDLPSHVLGPLVAGCKLAELDGDEIPELVFFDLASRPDQGTGVISLADIPSVGVVDAYDFGLRFSDYAYGGVGMDDVTGDGLGELLIGSYLDESIWLIPGREFRR